MTRLADMTNDELHGESGGPLTHTVIGRAVGRDKDGEEIACVQLKVTRRGAPDDEYLEGIRQALSDGWTSNFGELPDGASIDVGVATLPYAEEHDGPNA